MSRNNLAIPKDSERPFNIYADDFGVAVGLQISLTRIEGDLIVVRCAHYGRVFEVYGPTTPSRALEMAGDLIQGLQPLPSRSSCSAIHAR